MIAPKVFVHGVPEVDAIWGPLVAQLDAGHRVELLSPPGFGAPVPDGFEPTRAGYVDWLVSSLEPLVADAGPVDLVGHDWGTGHVLGVVVERPDLVHSWAIDIAGLLHPDYEWHDTAAGWQQDGVGEEMIAMMVGLSSDERRAAFVELGLSDHVLSAIVDGIDAEMGRCILALYRDAAQPAMRHFGERLSAAPRPPGLAINATADAYVSTDLTVDVAARLGVERLDLEGAGHWWMVHHGDDAARGLEAFWASV